MAIILLLSITISNAQIKNAKTETVKIYGNCGMCESTIEKAGNLKKVAEVDWNKDTKMATLTYDSLKTNPDEILKRIALAGYDSDKFLAPDSAYNNLSGCCQYERVGKTVGKIEEPKMDMGHEEHPTEIVTTQEVNQFTAIYDSYFAIKDALVKTDGTTASIKSKELLNSINAVKMYKLSMDVHMVWMKVLNGLKEAATNLSNSNDAFKQRIIFASLSANIYQLMKISKPTEPVYFNHCPMFNNGKGADWLSKENTIKNPYYGSMMLSCGKTVETIK